MRFIFGLIVGAITTLFVATAVDAPTHQIIDQGLRAWTEVSAQFTEVIKSEQTSEVSEPAPAVDPSLHQPAGPDLVPETEDVAESIFKSEPAAQPETVIPNTTIATQPFEVVVWAPFHSEASARGFATRLTKQLAHPFQVKKKGPAHYLVTYEYDDASSRSELERQIAHITGAPPS